MKRNGSFSAAVIGCGGLGCNAAVHLAGMGVKELFLCDFDVVEPSNLNRQFLFVPSDEGRPKAGVMAGRLGAYAPDTVFVPVIKKISSPEDLSFALGCGVIVSCVDNSRARDAISEFCARYSLSMVHGGIDGYFGSAYLYAPGASPCPFCAGVSGTADGGRASVSSTVGIIGALEAQLAYKALCGDFSQAGQLFVCDSGEISLLKIKQSADCRICNKNERSNADE